MKINTRKHSKIRLLKTSRTFPMARKGNQDSEFKLCFLTVVLILVTPTN